MVWNRGSRIAFSVAAAALLACGPVGAAEKMPTAENVVGAASVKFLRGVVNVVTCPLEIPRQVVRQVQYRGLPEGTCVGLAAGVGMTLVRCVAGGLEAVSFMVPEPGFYDPLIQPAYAWENWGAPVVE